MKRHLVRYLTRLGVHVAPPIAVKRISAFISLATLALTAACGEAPTGLGEQPFDVKPVFDDISNDLDVSIDAVAEVMPLAYPGPHGTTQLYVEPRNGDGKNGCNLTGPTSLVVDVASSNSSVATVSPSSVTFGSCDDTPTLTITPVGVGSATISLALSSNSTLGTFELGTATFTVNVAPAASNTPPTIDVTGVVGGASYDKGSVPAATCSVIDTEDGPSSFAATLSAISGTYASDGIGSQTASCSYTDAGGLTASASVTYSIVDPSPPDIAYVLTPASPDGSNSWYKSNVTLTWNVSDAESPNSLATAGCVDQNITADQGETEYSCSATSAGGSSGPVTVSIKRDATAPGVSYTSATSTPNGDGWYKSDVTATFAATDLLSGFGDPAASTQTANATTSGEGTNVSVGSPVFTDNAGNTAAAGTASSPGFKIDKTAPTDVAFVGAITDGGTYYFGSVPAAPSCTASDALSGLKSCTVGGYGSTVGTHTLTATAADYADNENNTAQLSYTVLAWTLAGFFQPVDLGDVFNTVKGGSTVPLKFRIFAGSDQITLTSAIQSFQAIVITCTGGATEDPVEELSATGGTSLRYDVTGGQFVQNWQTPKLPGKCYKVVMTTKDGSSIHALFKLK